MALCEKSAYDTLKDMHIFLTTKIWKEGRHHIAYTPELDVSSQGKTVAQAEERLREAVTAFLEETRHLGTFDEVMRAAGFFKSRDRWKAPMISLSSLEVSA